MMENNNNQVVTPTKNGMDLNSSNNSIDTLSSSPTTTSLSPSSSASSKKSTKKKFHLFHIHSNSSPNLKVYLNKDTPASSSATTTTNTSNNSSAAGSPRVAIVSSYNSSSGSLDGHVAGAPLTSSLSMSSSQLLTSSSSSIDTSSSNNNNGLSLSMSNGSLPSYSSTTTPPSSPRSGGLGGSDFDSLSPGSPKGASVGSPTSTTTSSSSSQATGKQKKKLLAGLRRKGGSNTNSKLRKEIADLSLKSGLQQQYTNLPFNELVYGGDSANPLTTSHSSPSLGGTSSPSLSSGNSKKKSKDRSNGRNSQRKSRFIEPIDMSTEDYTDIPKTIKLSVEFLFEKATRVPGIFRESANALELQKLKAAMESDQDINLSNYTESHNVGGLLKLYLRERPQPLFPYELHKKIIDLYESNPTKVINEEFCISVKELMMKELSKGQFLILRYLFELLHAVHLNAEYNNMNSYNLAVCFAPSLLHSFDCSCIEVVNRLVEDYELVFGIEVPVSAPSSPRTPSPSTSPSLRRKSRVITPNGSPKLSGRRLSSHSNGSRKSIHDDADGEQLVPDGATTSPHLESIVVPLDEPKANNNRNSYNSTKRSSQSPIQSRVVKQLIADDDDHSGFSSVNSEEEEELLISTSKRSSMALKRLSIMSRDIHYSDESSMTNEDTEEFEEDDTTETIDNFNNDIGASSTSDTSSPSNTSSTTNSNQNVVEQSSRKLNVKDIVSNINTTHPQSISILPTYKQPLVRTNSTVNNNHSGYRSSSSSSSSYQTTKNFSVPYNNNSTSSLSSSSSSSGSGYRKKASPTIQRRPVLSLASRSITSPSISFNKSSSMSSFSKYTTKSSVSTSSSNNSGSGSVVSSNHDSVANLKSMWEGIPKK